MLFGNSSKTPAAAFDRSEKTPAIKSSICTGETVAGFLLKDGKRFEEIICIRSNADLKAFQKKYGITDGELKHIY